MCIFTYVFSGKKMRKRKRGFRISPQVKRPNIIFVMADDLDVNLGSPEVMFKTKRILREGGTEFKNAFTTSPICCPSRSSILTGRYAHNHNVQTNNRNCSGPEWRMGMEKENFGRYMQEAGYETAYFGKYLNNYDGSYIPVGWDHWLGLIRNSRFYNYTLNSNGKLEKHKNDYKKDYFTNVITDASIEYFTESTKKSKPVMMVLSMSAPHGPEDSAPEYQHKFPNIKSPRTPNFNYTSPDKHWIIRNTPPMDALRAQFTDVLYRKRLQTLLSVDDAIEKLFIMLIKTGQSQNTYLMFSSDHGYHLGQFNQVKGKAQPYENDIRIPLYMRGPHIPMGRIVNDIALNIDFAPTFLDIAGYHAPRAMDGVSLMDVAIPYGRVKPGTNDRKNSKVPWRDTFLVERGKLKSPRKASKTKPSVNKKDQSSITLPSQQGPRFMFPSNIKRVERICRKPSYPKPPCVPGKKWVCVQRGETWFLQHCSPPSPRSLPVTVTGEKVCKCPSDERVPRENSVVMSDAYDLSETEKEMVQVKLLLLELDKQFGRLKRRIKKRGVKYFQKYLSKMTNKSPNRNETIPSSPKSLDNVTKEIKIKSNSHRVNRKIARTMQRLEYWQKERVKLHSKVLHGKITHKVAAKVKGKDAEIKLHPTRNITQINITTTQTPLKPVNSTLTSPVIKSCSCPKVPAKTHGKRKKAKASKKYKDMNCFHHDKHHWKTPPLWTGPGFTTCTNSPNSSYWCLRTINRTHNYLYCEFITGFKEYFDLVQDKFQLKNIISTVSAPRLASLQTQLKTLKGCSGTDACFVRKGRVYDQEEAKIKKLKKSERRKKRQGVKLETE